jgi:4-hydroxy-2-oxoheptanedioate aldolase
MYPNPLKQKLQGGELVLGTSLPAFTPQVAGMICNAGIDFVWICTEHSPYSFERLDVIPSLIRQRGVAPMIRVANNDAGLIKKAYDVGAVAVMVPQVDTPAEAAAAVEHAHYPPEGKRGITPNWPWLVGVDWTHVIRTANEETVLILQLESREAYDNLDAIVEVGGFDVLLVGPMDLSASVGRITETGCDEVQSIMEEVPRRIAGSGIVAGTTLGEVAEVQEKYRWGYRFLNVGNPMAYGMQVLDRNLATLRSDPTGERGVQGG